MPQDIHETPRGTPGRPQTDRELLLILVERLNQMNTQLVSIAAKLDGQDERYDERYVTREEFWPVKAIVYGGAGIVLVAVVGALVAYVVRGPSGKHAEAETPANHTRLAQEWSQ